MIRIHIEVSGFVQGVGFRPFIHRLATKFGLSGWVCNAHAVSIEVEGHEGMVQAFSNAMQAELPEQAEIHAIQSFATEPQGEQEFSIVASKPVPDACLALLSLDKACCNACIMELLTPSNRRYRYPFISCTDCGPRYTIMRDMPYDRGNTSQSAFALCGPCHREFETSNNRRFHAQTQACPDCGPQLLFADENGNEKSGDAISMGASVVKNGGIIAVKGIGGFHLICHAKNTEAVQRLRQIKQRPDKPLAVMCSNTASVAKYGTLNKAAADMLKSTSRPVVLLQKSTEQKWMQAVAPRLAWLGWMLPYTPIHHLLLHELDGRPAATDYLDQASLHVLVATSANISGGVLAAENAEVLAEFAGKIDGFLLHDRDILNRADDSLLCLHDKKAVWLRQARGTSPQAIQLADSMPSIAAMGADLKTTLTLSKQDIAFVSPHLGDMQHPDVFSLAEHTYSRLCDLLHIRPEAMAADLHPDFFSTRLAEKLAARLSIPLYRIQHHHAHVAAVMAEHHLKGPVLGLALDGFGFGEDGTVWGGEVLCVDAEGITRLGRLRPVPLPGGDMAARQPWRMAVSFLHAGLGDDAEELTAELFPDNPVRQAVLQLCQRDRTLRTSSSGRLFDAAAAIIAGCHTSSYEGQAAIELESLCERPDDAGYSFSLERSGRLYELDFTSALIEIANKRLAGTSIAKLATAFHTSCVQGFAELVKESARETGISDVVLCGGCMANAVLAGGLRTTLQSQGFRVWMPEKLPPGDAAISLGQAWVAARLIKV